MRYAQLFDGTKLSFPDDTPDEVINRVAREETLKRNAPPVQAPIAPSTERTAGEAVTDIGAALVSGTGRMLAFPGQAVSLIPGLRGFGSAIASPGEAIAEFGEGLKSQGLKVREALRSQAISEAEKDGILSEFGTAIKETLKDPALISTFLTEQVPNFLPPMLVGRLAAKIGVSGAQGLTGQAAEDAIAQAQRKGVGAAVGTGAVMQSADISSEAYTRAYEAAIAQGKPPEQAESEANTAARIAAGGAFGVSLATQRLPGARAIEQRLIGAPGGVSRVVGGIGEATSESLEEAGGALFQNIGIRTVDPNQSLTQGVGAAAGLGLLGGGFFGTLLSKKATPEPLPGQLPGETIEQSILRLVTERDSLKTPPVPESIIPDVDVIKLAGSVDENGNPVGYGLLTQYEERLKQLPESPERDQALQVASSVKERLNIESIQRQKSAYQNIITYKDMKDLGLNESDPLYESLVGKNLGAPDDATKVIETLNKELEQDIPSQRRELVGVMLEQVQSFLDQVPGSAFYAPRTDQRADGAGASVSDQLGAGTPGGPQAPSDASLDASTGLPGKRDEGEAEQPRPLRFETELGSTYEVNDAGETIRTKRSPGKGQGTTYPPHSALYVSPENIRNILDDRVGGNSVRIGYRKDYETGAMFAPVSDRSQIPEGAQPLVAVVSKTNNELVGVYPAQVSPEVGLHPVEKRYEGGQSFTHLGNKIVRLLTDKDIVTPKMLEGLGIKKQSAVAKRILGKEVTSAEVKAELAKRKQSLRTEEAQEQPQEAPQEVPQEVSPPETPKERIDAINKQLEGLMKRLLSKYGLKDVSVQIVKDMAAKGEFSGRLIKLADDTDNPLVDLRHEAIHALKELGFFTPAQWETLKNKAAQEWVQTYLKDAPYTDKVSRYEAYKQMFEAEGKNPQEVEEALIEEAIADAFSYFNKTRPPAGLMASINFRLKNLFKAFKTFLDESSLSAEDIFGRIDEGKLPSKAEAKAAEPPKASLRDTPKIDRQRSLNDKRISPRFPTAVKATEDVLAAIRLQPDLATFKRDPDAFRYNIGLMSKYPNFTDIKGTPNQRAEQIINRLKDNLLWLYNSWDTNLRDRSKLWYVGGNRIAHRWAQKYGIPPETAAAIIASLSPQKDWFQNVSLAERTLDAIVFNADFRWDAAMDRVFKERAWTKKFPVKQYRGKTLKEMYVPGDPKSLAKMAVWIRAWDEGHNPQTARVITPEGTFTNEIASGKTGAPIAMRAQSFAAMVKTLQIMQDSNLENFSNLIGKNHKVRSFYNNIIAPFAGDDVTIDTHAVAAALMRPLGSSDLEVYHNFGSAKPAKKDKEGNILVKAGKGTKNSAVTGLYGTYAIYAEAYRRAAQEVGVFPREMQSITWEAIRGLFRPEQKQARLKSQVDALWNKVAKGEINAEDARQQISKLVSGIEDPAWVKSPAGSNESRTDSSYATELPGDRVPGRGPEQLPGGAGERAAGVRATTGIIESGRLPKQSIRQGEQDARPPEPAVRPSGRGDERGAEVQPERTGDGRGRDQGRSLAPLEGAPNVQGATGPDPRLVEVAERYAGSKGIPYKRQARYVEVDEDRARRIAEAYDAMPHAPQDPAVKEAYADLIRQTKDQYQALIDDGYQFTFFDEDTDPYDGNPFNAMRDLRQNKRMAVYGTYDGYGTEGITGAAVEDNPMLEDTGLRWPDQNGVEHMVTANDLFRVVHDAFGHGLEGAGFRARGEENAWQAHARLFTGPAIGAITSETRGQNSWLNFGPYGDTNRTAKLAATVFATQKTGLMPEWTWTEGIAPDSRDVRYSLREDTRSPALILGTKQPNASEYFGVHYGNTRTDKLSGSKYGTGIRGAERRRLDQSFDDRIRKRVYFYVAKPDGSMPPPETGLGPYVYTQNMGNILGPGAEMQRINNQVNGESNEFESAVIDAGYDGYAVPSMGMMVVLNHDVPVKYEGTRDKFAQKEKGRGEVKSSLRTPKQNIRSQIPQNILTRVDATIAFREDKTVARRMMDAISPRGFSWFREQAINRYEYLSKIDRKYVNRMGGVRLLADQSAEAAALFSDLGAGITASAFGVHDRVGGIPVYRNGVVQVSNQNNTIKGPLAVFAPLGKYGDPEVYRLYEFWATVKRGARLNAQGKLTPFTPADIAHAQALQARFPEFVTIQREWIKYNDGLVKFMQDTGVITPQAAQEFKQHGDYFPMYKYFEGDEVTGPKVFSSIANVAAPKKYKGDDQPLGDFFENVVRNTQAAIQAGIKNIAAQRATQVALAVGEVTPLATRPTKMTPEVYRVLENGVEKYYAANDMMMISALKSLNIPDLPLIGVFAGPANLLRNLITKTPDFMMANMLRDSLSAWVTSGKNITPVISTMINFSKAIAEKSPELNALRNAGILGGYDYAQGVESTAQTFAKDLRKISNSRTTMEKITSPVTSLWGALEKASSASDAATRMEVYKKTLAETGNEAEALFQALEIMNFNRKGRSPVIRALTAAVPFLNARIQGLDVLYRAGIRPVISSLVGGDATAQEKARAKTFFLRGATIMALSAMYWMMTHDDEEYKVQEQETRDNYWLLPSLGVKIPIPFEIGVIFKVIPERVLEYSFGDDTGKDFVNAMSRQLLNTFSFNPIPQTVLPVVEAATNYSFFTTRPILGQGMEGIAPEFQATPTTSKTATSITDAYNSVIDLMPDAVAKKLRASPVILEHLIQGYTGTMGMYAMQTMDYIISANSDVPNASKRFEQMPVIRRFAVDPQARGTVTAFYDMKNAVDSVTRTASYLERTMNFEDQAEFIRDNIKTLAVKDYVQSLEKTMKEFRDQKLVIRSSTMSADAKRSYLDTIEKMELQLTANIRTLQKQMSSS